MVMLTNVRLAFPELWTPKAYKESAPAYSATFLVPKKSAVAKEMWDEIEAIAAEKFGKKSLSILESIKGNSNRFCVADGDVSEYDGYAGHWAARAKAKVRPMVIDKKGSPLTENDGKPYAGCFVNADVSFFGYQNPNSGISAGLSGVMFAGEGDSFGGGRVSKVSDFASLIEGADDDLEDDSDIA